MRKLCLALFVAAHFLPQLLAEKIRPEILRITALQAMQAYQGKWVGRQEVFLPNGKRLMYFETVQNYYWATVNNEEVLLGSGYFDADGERVNIESQMRNRFEFIELSVKDSSGKTYIYKGYVWLSTVVWVPEHLIFLLDITRDSFVSNAKYMEIFSENVKDVNMRSYKGYMIVKSILRKSLDIDSPKGAAPKKGGFTFKRSSKLMSE